MFNAIATIAMVLTLIFGGGGITAAAAQASLPDELLYPVKLLSEDVRYGMASEQTRLELELQYAEKRVTEIQQMTQAGQVPAEATMLRLQTQLRTALQSAAELENELALRQLEQIHTRLQNQLVVMDSTGPAAEPKAEAARLQTRQMIQENLALCEAGLTDPTMLKQQLRDRTRLTIQQTQTDVSSADAIASETAAGASNPWTTGTPTPGSSYGPGGQNPWTTGTPIPGSSYGPGTGTCEPDCLQNGTGDGTCSDCPQDGLGPQNSGTNDGNGNSGGGKP